MSEPRLESLVGDDDDTALADATRALSSGAAEELVEYVIDQLSGERSWSRDRLLRRLPGIPAGDRMLPFLSRALHDENRPDRRNAARSALAVLAGPGSSTSGAALDCLADMLSSSPDPDVRTLSAVALGESGNARARFPLEQALGDADQNPAAAAAESLGALGDLRAIEALTQAADHGTFWTQTAALLALGQLGDRRALPALARAAESPALEGIAVAALGRIPVAESVDLLRPRGAAPDQGTVRSVLEAAARIFGTNPDIPVPDWLREVAAERAPSIAAEFRESPDPVRARLLGIAATPPAVEVLFDALDDEERRADAIVGLELLPPERLGRLAVERLATVGASAESALLNLLPPLTDRELIRRVCARLGSADPVVRSAAAKALASSDHVLVTEALEHAVENPALRAGVARTYGQLRTDNCAPLLRLFTDDDALVREEAAYALGRCGGIGVAALGSALGQESDSRVRQALVAALGDIGGNESVGHLATAVEHADPVVRFAAVRALGRTRSSLSLDPLLQALGDATPEVRIAALAALGELGDPRAATAVHDRLGESSDELRRTAAQALGQLGAPATVNRLAVALYDPDREVRLTAVEVLRRVGGSAAIIALESRTDLEPSADVRSALTQAVLDLREERGGRSP